MEHKEYYRRILMLLNCNDLSLSYDGKTVVSGLSFVVNAGDYLCIVGENGSGKSTLMKTMLGLKTPALGQLVMSEGLDSGGFGYLPQQTEIQKDFPASVAEVVRSGFLGHRTLRPFYSKQEKRLAAENLEKFGIADLAKSCYRELSGGQQQRVLLARALCAAREVLLLDEPAAGLDPMAVTEMYALIKRINNDGITIIMISHDVAASVEFASHILHIGGTDKHFYGTVTEYLDSEIGMKYAGSEGIEASKDDLPFRGNIELHNAIKLLDDVLALGINTQENEGSRDD